MKDPAPQTAHEAVEAVPPLIREGEEGGPPAAAPAPQPQRSIGAIDGVVQCASCGRFPLVGEQVTRHIGRHGEEWACATCEDEGRGRRLGEVIGGDRVRSLSGAANVHRAL